MYKESGNLNLEREFLVRGVVFDALDTYTLYYALVIETTCLSPVFSALFDWVSRFSQIPPGGLILTARRLIKVNVCSCFGSSRLAAMSSCPAAQPWLCSV